MKGLSNALRGIGGQYELNRLVGAFGGIAYIVCANAFVAINIHKGNGFDVTAYCLAFPGGLAAIVGAIAGAVSWKDKGVASAKVIEQTGAAPGTAPVSPPAEPRLPLEERAASTSG